MRDDGSLFSDVALVVEGKEKKAATRTREQEGKITP